LLQGRIPRHFSIMSQHFKSVKRDAVPIAQEVIRLVLWVTQQLLSLLFRRPMINVLAMLLALWVLTSIIGSLLHFLIPQPEPVLYQPAAVFEGR
jgi:hypothetical protein